MLTSTIAVTSSFLLPSIRFRHIQRGVLGPQWPKKYLSDTVHTVSKSLKDFDPQLFEIIQREKQRQADTIALIASENYIPRYCSEALASCLSSRYSEGLPGSRYYAGHEEIDKVERLCQQRAMQAMRLDPEKWHVNVQALSGSPANLAVFTGILNPNDRILYLDLPHGGHLSHGFEMSDKKITATSKYFTCIPYKLDLKEERINYDEIEWLAQRFKPKIIIAGYSAHSRLLDYEKFRRICDGCGALLLADIAHIAGLMAAGVIPSAFDYSDIVTTTTHKTLRGPRGALIFCKKELSSQIDGGVFPGCQGGPHNHSIAAIAAALKAAATPEFCEYQKQVLANAQALATAVGDAGVRLVTGGTENHLILMDLSDYGIRGKKAEKAMEIANLIANKNTVLRDKSPKNPAGIRLGTPAMTTRGMVESDFKKVGGLIVECLEAAKAVDSSGKMKMKDFIKACRNAKDFKDLKARTVDLSRRFPPVTSQIFA